MSGFKGDSYIPRDMPSKTLFPSFYSYVYHPSLALGNNGRIYWRSI